MNIKKAKRGRQYKYEFSFKRKICAELLQGQITVPDLCRKYNISGGGTIYRWLKWYQEEQGNLVPSEPMAIEPAEPGKEPEKETRDLEEELRLAKAKITTLETMIDIAEEQFNIEIRKKSGTKPSVE